MIVDNNKNPKVNESAVIKWQYLMFGIAIILFIPSIVLSAIAFKTIKYGLLVPLGLICYIGISSIRNHVSILRVRGITKYSTGNKAVVFGVIILIGAIANIIFICTPLSDKFFDL